MREKNSGSAVWRNHVHAGYITAVPSNEDGEVTLLRPRLFRNSVAYRLGVPVINEDMPCPLCQQPINVYGDHAVCCMKEGDVIIRHNSLRNLVNSIATDGMLDAVPEKKGILGNTCGRKPGDVTIMKWSEGKGLCIDVAVTSPLAQSCVRIIEPCEDYAAIRKHAEYDTGFKDTEYIFSPMVFETLGAINTEGEEVLKQISNLPPND